MASLHWRQVAPGGSTIITIVLQMILNTSDFNMGIAEATAAPRFHHQWLPDMAYFENGISSDSLYLLQKMGHHISPQSRVLGSTQSIAVKVMLLPVLIQEDRVPLQLHKNLRLISTFPSLNFLFKNKCLCIIKLCIGHLICLL